GVVDRAAAGEEQGDQDRGEQREGERPGGPRQLGAGQVEAGHAVRRGGGLGAGGGRAALPAASGEGLLLLLLRLLLLLLGGLLLLLLLLRCLLLLLFLLLLRLLLLLLLRLLLLGFGLEAERNRDEEAVAADRLAHRVRGSLGAGPVDPLGDDVLDVDVAVAAGDGVGGVVPALTGGLGEGLAVQVEQDVAVLGGVAGSAVADEEVGLLAVVDDVALGAQRPAGAGGQALLHGLAAGGGAGVAVDAGTVVPEVGRLDFAVLDRAVRTHVKSTRSVAGRSRPGAADPGMTGSGHGGFGHAAGAHLRRAVRECAGPAPFSAPLGAVLAASAAAPRPPLIVGASTGRARSAPGWDT